MDDLDVRLLVDLLRDRISPDRSLGQHFLLDEAVIARAVHIASATVPIGPECHVLEIGPGPGGLTRGLLAEGARKVTVIEKDSRCIGALNEIREVYPNRLKIIEGDALKIDLAAHLTAPTRVVANLPYNVGTELLVRWLTPRQWPPYWDSLTLMFQREVAERIVAKPGDRAYGRLAILAQWRCNPRIAMYLPPDAFTPVPKVSSALVHLDALEHPRFEAEQKTLEKIVATAFNQRRKMLRSSLKDSCFDIKSTLEKSGIQSTKRAEEISLEQFCTLAREIKGQE